MKGLTALEALTTMDSCLLETSFVRTQNVSSAIAIATETGVGINIYR